MWSKVKLVFAITVVAASVTARAQTHEDVRGFVSNDTSPQLEGGRVVVTPPYDYFWKPGMSVPSFGGNSNKGGETQTLGSLDKPINFDHTLVDECGQNRAGITPQCTGTVTPPTVHPAPEMDWGFALQGVMLLVGGLLVLRSRIRSKVPTVG